MIIDTFTFYNESKILEFRLKELNDTVDYFVIVEATKTHSGNSKELWFQNNKDKFKEYLNKIIHIVVDDFPDTNDAWVRERFQRQCIMRGLDIIKPDISDLIIVSDCDEIPDPKTLNLIHDLEYISINSLQQEMYYYNLECKHTYPWYASKVVRYGKLKEINCLNTIRSMNCLYIENGGWHFSYFNTIELISNKIKNFAHQEYNDEKYTSLENITEAIKSNVDLFGRTNSNVEMKHIPISENKYLPYNWEMLMISQ